MADSSWSSDEMGLKKGPWAAEEDAKLLDYINKNGYGNWRSLPERAGLNRCGKSCRLRWTNYLRPDIKRGNFSDEEERTIIKLHKLLGNKWSKIATHLPGRTDNEIKNYWNTHIRKTFLQMGLDPITHKPRTDHLNLNNLLSLSQLLCLQQFSTLMGNNSLEVALKLQADAAQIAQAQLSQNLLQIINSTKLPTSQNPNFQLHQGLFNGVPAEGSLFGNSSAGHGLVLGNNSLFDCNISSDVGRGNKYPSLSNNSSFDARTVAGGQLPALVSPETNSTGADQWRKSNMDGVSSSFEAWDKVMDDGDEASGAYWKDLLDWTSSPSSPASWQQQLQ